MSDPSNQPRLEEPHTGVMPGAALNDWNPADVEVPPLAAAVTREPIFSRRVLIGWALVALIAYFGVHLIGNVIRSTVREAINTASEVRGDAPGKEIIYQTPNRKIIITRDYPGGPISITRRKPDGSVSGIAAEAAAQAAAATANAVDAAMKAEAAKSKAPPAPPPAKR